MFKTIRLEVNAENPHLPIQPSNTFEGSAISYVIVGVPACFGERKITGVCVNLTNVGGQTAAFAAKRVGMAWGVTVPASAVGQSGLVQDGVVVSASGTDENGDAVDCWILGAGDLEVNRIDGTVAPGTVKRVMHWFDERPERPEAGDVAPHLGVICYFNGAEWIPFGSGDVTGRLPMRPLPPYLHQLPYDDTYPADAAWLYAQLGPSDLGRCSAVRRGGKLYRNYDWTFDHAAEFVVKMSGNDTRFASVGVASVGSRLAENDVMSAVNSRYYKCLPGMTLDGINEKGVVCEINVDGGPKDGWHGTGANALHILAAVRWVLDHGETAQQAAEHIAANVIQPTGEMNFHFMVADATATYIVENGVAHDVTDGTKVLTNYALYDEAHAGGGKERYTLLADGADITDAWFTNAYRSGNGWDSDFDSPEQHAEAIRQWAEQGADKEAHRGKTTTGGKAWWQSVHTAEYDFAAKTMKVAVQESDEFFTFAAGGAKVELDDEVTQSSANGVKSSGVWTWVKSLLPSWLTASTEEPRGKTDFNAGVVEHWDFTGTDAPTFPNPRVVWTGTDEDQTAVFVIMNGDAVFATTDGAFEKSETRLIGWYRNVEGEFVYLDLVATRSDKTYKLARTSHLTAGGLAKFGADGVLDQATPSSTGGESADYRDPKDAKCYESKFTEWTFTSSDADVQSKASEIQIQYDESASAWKLKHAPTGWFDNNNPKSGSPDDTEVLMSDAIRKVSDPGIMVSFTATRKRVAMKDEAFVTPGYVKDAADPYVVTDAVDGGVSVKINGETVTMFADLLAKCKTGRAVLYGQATTVETGYAFYTAASVTDSVIQFQASGMLYDKSNIRYGMYVRRIKIVPRANGGLLVDDSGLEGPFASKDYVDGEGFASSLMSKQVAITAIDARIKTNAESAAEPTNAVTLNDNAPKTVTVATATSDSLAVTFGAARNGGLRICELYILNGTADTDLTFDAATVSFVATGDSFPACEAGINYFVFAEVAANLWKVTRETLKSITTPTPVAA